MKATLFGSRLSPFVEKAARALEMKGIAFDLVPPKSPGDFKKWNPATGKMPVLEVDGERIHDSTFILRRLDEIAPDPPLYATDATAAAKQRFVEDWSDESLYWYCMAFRWAPENQAASAAQIASTLPAFLRPLLRLLLPRQIGGLARAQGLARLPMDMLIDQLAARLDEFSVLLGDSPFLFSDRLSGADLAVFGQARAMQSGPTPQCDELIAARPALVDYLRRVDETSRPRSGKRGAKLRAA